jgi:hypothetical protein
MRSEVVIKTEMAAESNLAQLAEQFDVTNQVTSWKAQLLAGLPMFWSRGRDDVRTSV